MSTSSLKALVARLSYANVVSTLALFIVLGGGAYAAATLPRNSVGRSQIRAHAVDTSELAPRSVTPNRLSPWARRRLSARLRRGPRGAVGPAGAPGPAAVSGSGASRIAFSAPASASPAPSTVLDLGGLTIKASCIQSGADVGLSLQATSSEDAVLQDRFTVDTGSDPTTPSAATTGNVQINLTANVEKDLGGPSASGSDYFRSIADGVAVTESRTIVLTIFAMADAASGRCSMGGTALPTS
jgi:hypothetical protein